MYYRGCKYCSKYDDQIVDDIKKIVFTDKMINDLKNIEQNENIKNWISRLDGVYFMCGRNCKFHKTFMTSDIVVNMVKKVICSLIYNNSIKTQINYYNECNLKILSKREKNIVAKNLIKEYPLADGKNKMLYDNNDFSKLNYYYRNILFCESKKLFKHIQRLFLNYNFTKLIYSDRPYSGNVKDFLKDFLKDFSNEECLSIVKNECIIFYRSCDFLRNKIYVDINSMQSWIDNCKYLFEDRYYILSKILGKDRIIIKKQYVITCIKVLGGLSYKTKCMELILNNFNNIDSEIIIELIRYNYSIHDDNLRNILSINKCQKILLDIHKKVYRNNNIFFGVIRKHCENEKYWDYHLILQKFKNFEKINEVNMTQKKFRIMFPLKFLIENMNYLQEYNYYLEIIKDFNYQVNKKYFKKIIEIIDYKNIPKNLLHIYNISHKK